MIKKWWTPDVRPPGFDLEALVRVPGSLVRSFPPWIERFGLLAGPDGTCLWCESRPAAADTFPGQIVLDLSPGRYLVDIFDTASAAWVSRESAEGGPLVAGLPFSETPLLVWIRPLPPKSASIP